jgi:quinoprotein glucose dehydrogenase
LSHATLYLLLLAPAAQEYKPVIQPASDEGQRVMESFELAAGLEVSLFAAEPMLANPVCLTIDNDGSVYVGETFRHHAGVTDIRDRLSWLEDDLASKTVADRLAYMKKHAGDSFDDYAGEQDRVRLLRDTDGDGAADLAVVFAGGFDKHETGIGAGLLALDGDVYYTCIPDLWLLRDLDGDGFADEQTQLSTGYGTNTCLLGHDLHGLRIGPDGLLYFSSGDRGFNVETENGVLAHAAKGAVLRCRLDGSELEVYHTGLRNPQELAFDDRGNLFTGDNNSDGGDEARWVEVVEGADSGWRYPYQWIEEPNARGPWNDEKLWHTHHEGQAAYILPPLANITHGPSGLTHYPGTGLADRYADNFFLCDFRGGPGYSGVHSFGLIPKGASFEVGPTEHFVWNCLPTDIEFGPGGGLYFTDWVTGWGKPGRGRIYHLSDPESMQSAIVAETATLLREGADKRATAELLGLLGHADQRVRQQAQFALVARADEGFEALVTAALTATPEPDAEAGLFARLHGIWGAGMAARETGADLQRLAALFEDPDPEIRGQIARTVGGARFAPALSRVNARLADEHARVQFQAALACGRLGSRESVKPLLQLAREAGADPYIRHAVVYGLNGCISDAQLESAASDESIHVRTAALLVYRRREAPEVARFLMDPDLALEAARAIHDVPIPEAMHALAAELDGLGEASNAWARRVMNANFRSGGDTRARALGAFALRAGGTPAQRAEALDMLASWEQPGSIDRVVGAWRPIEARSAALLPELVIELLEGGIDAGPIEVATSWIRLAAEAGAHGAATHLARWVADGGAASVLRVESLLALESLEVPDLALLLDKAFVDRDGELRATALAVLDRMSPELALPRIPSLLEGGEFQERRTAYRILQRSQDTDASAILERELAQLARERVPAELSLDLIESAEAHATPELLALLSARSEPRSSEPELAPYLDSLFGGDSDRGRKLFREDAQLTCLRCHAAASDEAPRIGPDLTGVGKRLTRLQLLESVALPNRRISTGYQGSVLFMLDGDVLAGLILEENADRIRILKSDGQIDEVHPMDVETRRPDLSSMPEGLAQFLSRREMRDLLEYLGTL